MNYPRQIIDFRKGGKLPEWFIPVTPKRMIYAAGDGYGSYNGPRDGISDQVKIGSEPKTNIESFIEQGGYNIFCCLPDGEYDRGGNLRYLQGHPELNIIVCYLTGDNARDFATLRRLLSGSLEVIDTDDPRFFPDSKTCFDLLQPGRICKRVFRNIMIGQYGNPFGTGRNTYTVYRKPDAGWGPPNFTIVEVNGFLYTLQKTGDTYQELSDFSFLGEEIQSLQLAKQLNSEERKLFIETVRPNNTSNRWKAWRERNPLHPHGGFISKTRKRRGPRRKARRVTRKRVYA